MKGFALGLALTQRRNATWKSPIITSPDMNKNKRVVETAPLLKNGCCTKGYTHPSQAGLYALSRRGGRGGGMCTYIFSLKIPIKNYVLNIIPTQSQFCVPSPFQNSSSQNKP